MGDQQPYTLLIIKNRNEQKQKYFFYYKLYLNKMPLFIVTVNWHIHIYLKYSWQALLAK